LICHFYLKGLDAVCYDKETTIWGECKFSCLKIILLFKEAKQYSEHHWKFKCLCSLIQHCYTNSVYSFPETESSLRKRGLRFCAAHPLKSMICDRRSCLYATSIVRVTYCFPYVGTNQGKCVPNIKWTVVVISRHANGSWLTSTLVRIQFIVSVLWYCYMYSRLAERVRPYLKKK